MVGNVRSRRSLYFSSLAIGAIALGTFACGGFDVPSWTRPAGPGSSIDETEPAADESKTKALDDDSGEPATQPTSTPASDAGDGGAGDAGPQDAGAG
jgi:hypothetical protein